MIKKIIKSLKVLAHKINRKTSFLFTGFRRLLIKNKDFTIISNNCWGGKVYEHFGLRKNSPTIGAYFFASDYIKFIYNLKKYTNKKIEIIEAKQSKHYKKLKQKGQLDVPVGKIDDIEIVFLHYKNPNEAKEKWERRVKRINWDNLIFKFSYMNECSDIEIEKFCRIKGIKKVLFVGKEFKNIPDSYVVPVGENGQIENDTDYWNKYLNIYKLLNSKPTPYKNIIIENKK